MDYITETDRNEDEGYTMVGFFPGRSFKNGKGKCEKVYTEFDKI